EAIVAGVVRVAGAGAFIFSEEPVETSDSFSFPFRLCPPLPIFWRGFTDSPTFFIFGFLRGQREVECPVVLHPRQVFALPGQLATTSCSLILKTVGVISFFSSAFSWITRSSLRQPFLPRELVW